jgi:hypothetical protein
MAIYFMPTTIKNASIDLLKHMATAELVIQRVCCPREKSVLVMAEFPFPADTPHIIRLDTYETLSDATLVARLMNAWRVAEIALRA